MTVNSKTRKTSTARAAQALQRSGDSASASVAAPPSVTGSVGRDLLVPLDHLVIGEANVRKVVNDNGLAELSALIEAQGLLQRLGVVALPGDRFAVVAGGRRLRAMEMLVAAGRWPASQPVECKLFEDAQAVQVSLAENSGREAMHPADQMDAFLHLIEKEGLGVAQVAGRFGVSSLTVERRLKLARLSPRFLAMYRADEIAPDQLMALALLDDHAAQEAAWDSLGAYDRSAWRIRQVVSADNTMADSRLARFVGLEAYEAAGGVVRRDLFATPDDLRGIFLDTPELLRMLATEKIKAITASVQAEGWSWTDFILDNDPSTWRQHRREEQAMRELSEEESVQMQELAAERRRLAEAYDLHQEEGDPESEGYDAEATRLEEALDDAEARLEAAQDARRHWSPEQLARTGAVARLDARGEVVIDRGLVRPGDRKTSESGTPGSNDADADATEADETKAARPEYSEKLMRDLTAHRTAALQASLLDRPDVALVALVHRMAETLFCLYSAGNDVVRVTLRPTSDDAIAQDATDYADSPASLALQSAEQAWADRLPGDSGAMFAWLLAQPQAVVLELLTYCAARSVNAVAGRARRRDQSDALADAVGLDMADWWLPTTERYLSRVSKAKALEAVKEATGVDEGAKVVGMKKAEAAKYCAARLEGTRWVPAPLRPPLVAGASFSSDDESEQENN